MKILALLVICAVALAGCTSGGRPASPSNYGSLRMPWQKRADPSVQPIPAPTDPVVTRSPRYPQPASEREAPPIAAPRETVISEPAPPPPRRS